MDDVFAVCKGLADSRILMPKQIMDSVNRTIADGIGDAFSFKRKGILSFPFTCYCIQIDSSAVFYGLHDTMEAESVRKTAKQGVGDKVAVVAPIPQQYTLGKPPSAVKQQ